MQQVKPELHSSEPLKSQQQSRGSQLPKRKIT